jgi:hypothetical protein
MRPLVYELTTITLIPTAREVNRSVVLLIAGTSYPLESASKATSTQSSRAPLTDKRGKEQNVSRIDALSNFCGDAWATDGTRTIAEVIAEVIKAVRSFICFGVYCLAYVTIIFRYKKAECDRNQPQTLSGIRTLLFESVDPILGFLYKSLRGKDEIRTKVIINRGYLHNPSQKGYFSR